MRHTAYQTRSTRCAFAMLPSVARYRIAFVAFPLPIRAEIPPSNLPQHGSRWGRIIPMAVCDSRRDF
jgi:hypothetical protein